MNFLIGRGTLAWTRGTMDYKVEYSHAYMSLGLLILYLLELPEEKHLRITEMITETLVRMSSICLWPLPTHTHIFLHEHEYTTHVYSNGSF